MIRVLVVDDSPVARELLTGILDGEPDMSVVGVATNGAEAVAKVAELQPDIVTMDVQMPRMNGYDATREIMITQPTPIVVVSGSMGKVDVEKSMQSLEAGALTIIGKPDSPSSPLFEEQCRMLHDTLRTMSAVKVIRQHRPRTRVETPPEEGSVNQERLQVGARPKLVTIAASTGGPQALRMILQELPAAFELPIVVVQHISSGFTSGLVDWLNGGADVEVTVASQGTSLQAGHVYLAPEGKHCGVRTDGSLEIVNQPPLGGFRPSATMLYESASRTYAKSQVAVILTGMGKDGVDGLRSVKQTGGAVIAQDEESSVVFGMPKAAIEADVVDLVLPLDQIARELIASTP